MSMAVESSGRNASQDEATVQNAEICSLDLDLSPEEWNDYSNQHQSFSQNFGGLTSDSFSSAPNEIPPSTSSQSHGASFLSNLPSSRSSSVYNSFSFQSFSEGSFDAAFPSCYGDGSQSGILQLEPESLDQRSSASWDLSSEIGDQNQALFCHSPDLELVTPDNEWESVGGTDLLCKLVPECSKELLNLFKLPGQAKRRRYLTVRDMLNIKDKLSRVRSVMKNDTFAGCLSPTPSLFTADSNVASEELFSVDENETPNSSVLSPPEDLSSIEAFINSAMEPGDTSSVPKKPRLERTPRGFSQGRLVLPNSPIALPAASMTESVDSNPCDSSYRGSLMTDDNYKRPRHFDFSTLEIGEFRVAADPLEANQLCRLKVISASQKLVYEYEIPPRVTATNRSLVLVTRVISIEVPFLSITAAGCSDNIVQLIISSRPFTFIGYRSSFTGQSRCCVYDKSTENEVIHGELERCPLHRITFHKAETANRLKYHLLGCHPNFYALFQNSFPNVGSTDFLTDHEPFGASSLETEPEVTEVMRTPSSLATAPFVEAPAFEKASATSFCSCKVSCRSKRCSCARQGKLCQNCRCVSCENPLNLLRDHGVNVVWAQSAPCLMNSIYLLNPKNLSSRLYQKLSCPSCGYAEQVLNLMKNGDSSCCPECLVRLAYSWCKDQLFLVSQHQLRHCDTCQRCVDSSRGAAECPRCFLPFSSFVSLH